MRALLLLLLAAAVAPAQSEPEAMQLHVSQRGGSDAGDGSPDKPFATIRRALALQAKFPGRRTEIQLQLGHYGADTGEIFPIKLPAGVRLTGVGSRSCEIVAPSDQPVLELPSIGAVSIASVALRGGTVGLAAVRGGDGAALEVALADVAIDGCAIGVDLAPARGTIALRADGLRVARAATSGLQAGGGAELTLRLERSRFTQCKEGVVLASDGAAPEGPFHAVVVRDCSFDGNEAAGFVRRGGDGQNRAPQPLRIESTTFRGGHVGVSFETPGGDVPCVIRDCTFVENDLFGVALVGSGAPLEGASRLERCRFRWNGVGVQILTAGRPLELEGCRVEDSVGSGVSFGNWIAERARLQAVDCLFAANGAAGVVATCEGAGGVDLLLDRCTVADNRGAGVERRSRGPGRATVRLERCVVAGNAPDLARIEAAESSDGFVGGDPRFADRTAHDWRLRDDSPARADGVVRGATAPVAPAATPSHR